ncbi:MAG TPA: hypothetical protein VL463_17635 [Kofleriaceae bacterium]|nr:hypothetical protein [Kofleriaceae bacterium]
MKKIQKKGLALSREIVRDLSKVTGAMESTSIGCVRYTTLCVSAANPASGCTSCPSCGDCTLMKP